ncbi:hypothetical protein [Companilactobacillus zhongbaensis]|uniref:hypothetical protein n=1 Tax=Companilactobacillus zhongbaensis TaxID=2486009 RepID=UPI000F768347|nr:hypothetical protein [Companilactobacillus zhongbaensis]
MIQTIALKMFARKLLVGLFDLIWFGWDSGNSFDGRSLPVPGRGAIWDWNVADIDLNYPRSSLGHFKYESYSKR